MECLTLGGMKYLSGDPKRKDYPSSSSLGLDKMGAFTGTHLKDFKEVKGLK